MGKRLNRKLAGAAMGGRHAQIERVRGQSVASWDKATGMEAYYDELDLVSRRVKALLELVVEQARKR